MPYLSSTQLPGALVFLLLPWKSRFAATIYLNFITDLHVTSFQIDQYTRFVPTFFVFCSFCFNFFGFCSRLKSSSFTGSNTS